MRIIVIALATFFSISTFAEIKVDDAWVRLLPPNIKTTAAYMNLDSSLNDVLLEVSSPAALMVEMHESTMEEGVMSMNRVNEIILSANQKTELKPGGLHLMIMGLTQALSEGAMIPLELRFESAGVVEVQAIVRQ